MCTSHSRKREQRVDARYLEVTLKFLKASIGWNLEELEALAEEERAPDSDDESEVEIEQMTPTVL